MAIKTYKRGSAAKLSKNFIATEFDCEGTGCCTNTLIDDKLVEYLQKIRDHFGKPIGGSHLTAYRCPTHNANVANAAKGSLHTKGMAADISIEGVTPAEIAKYAESIGVLGIGLYDTFVHIDTRDYKSFWYGHQQEYRSTFGGAVQNAVETVKKSATAALPMLRKGSAGNNDDAVFALQTLLAGYGYLRGKDVTGKFDTATENALKEYQSDEKIDADGICGPVTWACLLGV